MTAPSTLEQVRNDRDGDAYPRHLLDRCDDALVMFAAGFHGRQDAFWIQDAGVHATCVDLDGAKLRTMQELYPRSWEFVCGEAFEFVATAERAWDLVSVDCPTAAFARCADMIGAWCDLARRAVVLGTNTHVELDVPAGWCLTDFRRRSGFRGGVYWAVLERE